MTLDDAIVAFGQIASDDFDSIELEVRDYERLVKWLIELKLARESAFSDIWLTARAVSENDQLKAENSRLRELAKGLYEFAYAEYPRAAKAGFANDLSELGIEVDEWAGQ